MSQKMVFECAQSRDCADDWIVEAIDLENEGVIYAATFSGPKASERASEYAAWKNVQEKETAEDKYPAAPLLNAEQMCAQAEADNPWERYS